MLTNYISMKYISWILFHDIRVMTKTSWHFFHDTNFMNFFSWSRVHELFFMKSASCYIFGPFSMPTFQNKPVSNFQIFFWRFNFCIFNFWNSKLNPSWLCTGPILRRKPALIHTSKLPNKFATNMEKRAY